METPFDFSVMEELLKKASLDETGELSVLINNLIMAGRKAGHSGMTLHEIASVVTMGYYVAREPELESIVQFLLSKTKPNEFLN
jgi:hypothetical protein|tara:strand:+ start:1384 stop:1635 length:252 start_codon:yes stop_codon:yes gene_type:complete